MAGGFFAVAGGDGDGAFAGHHVAAGEDACGAGHHIRPDDHGAIRLEGDAGHGAQEAAIGFLAQSEDDGVGGQGVELPGGFWPAIDQAHALDGEFLAGEIGNGGEPADFDPFLDRLIGFEPVRGHVRPVAAIDDDGFIRAEPAGGAGSVHRRIAAAVDDHAAAELRRGAGADIVQIRDCIEHAGGFARGNVGMAGDMGADGDEGGIEPAGGHAGGEIGHLQVAEYAHAHAGDAGDFLRQHIARQAVGGDAEMQHAAGQRPGFVQLNRVASAGEVVGGGEAGWPGADDQDTFAGRWRGDARQPALRQGGVAKETFDGVDADRCVQRCAIAAGFARVVADAAVYGGHGVVI